jgi:hypothetical protein
MDRQLLLRLHYLKSTRSLQGLRLEADDTLSCPKIVALFVPYRMLICFRNGNQRLLQTLILEPSPQVPGSGADEFCSSGRGKGLSSR